MATRVTRVQVEAEFGRFVYNLVDSCGWTEEQARGLALDYNPAYGGVTISASEGSVYPTGGFMDAGRVPLAEMYRRLRWSNALCDFRANARNQKGSRR